MLFTYFIKGQQYGNEWINYNQNYFHFSITQTGVHRLYHNEINNVLNQQGIDLNQITHSQFQIYGREQEVSLLINDANNNGYLDTNEYIEFYAEKNDGWLDENVYDSLHHMPDSYFSLFNDTIKYYFTWNNAFSNKRTSIETDTNYSTYTSNSYCWKKTLVKFNTNYVLGEQVNGLSSPKYNIGEGWAGPTHSKGGNYTDNLATNNYFSSGPNAFGEINLMSSNSSTSNTDNFNHNSKLYVNNNLILDTSYYGYKIFHVDFEIPSSSLSNSTTIRHNIGNIGQGTDYQNIASLVLCYPHTTNFSNYSDLHFGLNYNANQKKRLTISNMISGSNHPILYMIDDINRVIPLTINNNNWEAVIPPPSSDSNLLFLFDESNIINISKIEPVNHNGIFNDYNSLQLDSAYIIITHKKLISEARNFANYRSNQYDTLVVDIEELYHQYSSGIYKNPLAIRRFIKSTMDIWPTYPSHIFLIGKSVRYNDETTPGARFDSLSYSINLVPTWGYPSSDNHILVGLSPNKRGYPIPIGRLSAFETSSVANYLNKVIELESNQGNNSPYTISNKQWQKNIIHFSGGSDSSEQAYMNNRLNEFKSIIEDTLYGGNVHTFGKDPFSNIINPYEFQETQALVENGVSLITFFGHASAGGGFSQNIDNPENWNNQGKYPMVIGLGCFSGDVHNPDSNSYAEQLIRTNNSGAIGFISTIKQGFVPLIDNYTKSLYEMISKYGYNKTIGQQMVMAIDSLDMNTANIFWDPKIEGNYNGMALQGDPSVKLNTHSYPELLLQTNNVWTEPSTVNLSINDFELNVIVNNLGKACSDSVYMEVKQNFPDGSDTIYAKKFPGTKNIDTVTFIILNMPEKSIGQNIFDISIDLPLSFIQEAEDEINNNQIEYTINISSNSILPVWPYDFSIIGNPNDTLRVSTINPLEPINNYYFEIDTTDYFNSPFLKRQTLASSGGVIEAVPANWTNANSGLNDPLNFTDSTVYYWRACPDSSVLDWKYRSFQYVPNKWGWAQAHFNQFRNNDYNNIQFNENNKSFDFSPTFKSISCKTYIQNVVLTSEWSGTLFQVNGQTAEYGGYITPQIMIGVINPNTLDYWRTPFVDNSITPSIILNPNNCFGQFNGDPAVCSNTSLWGRNREQGHFMFNYYNTTHLDSLSSMLDNKIPDGYYIVAYSYIPNNYGSSLLYSDSLYKNWPTELFNSFQSLGATGFNNQNQHDDGFIFFCKKGDLSSAITHRTNEISPGLGAQSQLLELNTTIYSNLENGKITSPIIGPSYNWKSIYWNQNSLENPTKDSTRIKIIGLQSPTIPQEVVLVDTIFSSNDSLLNLYPILYKYNYLKLEMESYDDSLLTPSQINKWQLIYDPLPDLAINPKKSWFFDFDSTNLQQGDSGFISIAIENVTPFNMDSLIVDYNIENDNNTSTISYPKQDSLRAREVFIDTLGISTRYYQGHCNLNITANPILPNGTQNQLEEFYFNNFLKTSFSVNKDNINPILDVTFDGVHILNNDIISPNPTIVIELDDENQFLIMNEDIDTSNFQIEIKRPLSNQWERIYFSNNLGLPNLNWELANEENKFIITYEPSFDEDGTYGLRIQGQDKSGNISGDQPYQIFFEVIQESSITNIYNYPNPFTTKTHFVFTLTGSQIPNEFNIQILNINGRLIKQIPLHETESIKIGNNITEYYWDGKDDFGDPLANGVYLYRVFAKINNKEIKHRNSSGDHAFNKGFGKIYLIR